MFLGDSTFPKKLSPQKIPVSVDLEELELPLQGLPSADFRQGASCDAPKPQVPTRHRAVVVAVPQC